MAMLATGEHIRSRPHAVHRKRPNRWSDPRRWGEVSLLLSPQDAIEIGISLLGLQPHIRDVLARREKVQDVQEVEYPTPDMDDQDL